MTAPAGALAATLAKLPDHPGVYLMRDARGTVLYVGKAQSLRHRVRSYWQRRGAAEPPLRIESSLDRVADVEYTLTDTVSEALLVLPAASVALAVMLCVPAVSAEEVML